MANGNNITIVGNLVKPFELRFTPSGAAVGNSTVAVNRRWQNKQSNEWEEQVSFFDVTCWTDLAENVTESLEKGDRVVVTGRLDQRTWETGEGEKRSKVEIVADEVAPSLRWATVQVTKNERSDSSPYAPAAAKTAPKYDNEEPF